MYIDIPKKLLPFINKWVFEQMFYHDFETFRRCDLSPYDFRYKALKDFIAKYKE